VKIEKLKVGQIVYNLERRGMGNTTLRTTSAFAIKITEVDPAGQWVMASWNFNSPRKFRAHEISKWREKKPIMHTGGFGVQRLATKKEIAYAEAQKACGVPEGDRCIVHDIPFGINRVGGFDIKACWRCLGKD
jgi:hypothetical protein